MSNLMHCLSNSAWCVVNKDFGWAFWTDNVYDVGQTRTKSNCGPMRIMLTLVRFLFLVFVPQQLTSLFSQTNRCSSMFEKSDRHGGYADRTGKDIYASTMDKGASTCIQRSYRQLPS